MSHAASPNDDASEVSVADLYGAFERDERAAIVSRIILAEFDAYYSETRETPRRVKAAFEARDWPRILTLSRERLARYSAGADRLAAELRSGCPEITRDQAFWSSLIGDYRARTKGRYEADLALAFLLTVRRELVDHVWRPLDKRAFAAEGIDHPREILRRFEAALPATSALVRDILDVGRLEGRWRDRDGDSRLVAAELNRLLLRAGLKDKTPFALETVDCAFFRNRGAYLVGRVAAEDVRPIPILIAILNGPAGFYVDAVLHEGDQLQYVFSSTLANFHVENPRYHELAAFLHELMPKRPLGLHYSTIGFNHVGKTAVMDEIERNHAETGEVFDTAPGFRGTVAIGFTTPSSHYVLKIIRDRPTAGYKWGTFAGVEAVLGKYRLVHDADRAGSMLDNVLYKNVALAASLFAPALLDELLEAGAGAVRRQGSRVLFRHLVVQMKMTPLPLFLATASPEEARAAVLSLGDCIKNNAAVNIFNKDLDGRNYGVSPILRVYLFDYDAVERLTDVKIRTNAGREEGEEDVPDWFFEDGVIFLPEELMSGLRLEDPELRRLFKTAHHQLLSVDYWLGMQRALCEGKVPMVRSYPSEKRLHRHLLKAYGSRDAAE